jgi:two-component system, chemotaxis family, sensor kinase CheA
MDMSQYKDLFVSESREYVRSIGSLIIDLEKDAGDKEKIDTLFRATHSIKGMAASMEFGQIAGLAHKLEDLMAKVRKGTLAFDRGVTDLLLEGADCLDLLITDVETGAEASRDTEDLIARIAAYEPLPDRAGAPAVAEAATATTSALPPPENRGKERGGAREQKKERSETRQTVRVKTALLDHLINITGELITNKHRLINLSRESGKREMQDAVTDLSRLLRLLHNEVLQVRLMPFDYISDRFPRQVRDLAKKRGKEVDLSVEGGEIELDRGMLEDLTDPLVHILRNAVDHGMESSDERRAAGKPAKGKISLTATREKDHVVITVTDDGRGMDAGDIVATALERGFISRDQAAELSLQEALLLTCLPGFSTAGTVTDVSGRGVGMDVVRSTIQSLCGTLAIESAPGEGTRIIIKLPLTVAIINVLLIGCGSLTMAVPVTSVIRTLELGRDLISGIGSQKVFCLDGEELPLLSLNRIFGQPLSPVMNATLPVFVCEVRGRRIGLAVDRFLGHQEAFIKHLGRPLDKLRGVAGSAVMGDGEVIFILDVANLL